MPSSNPPKLTARWICIPGRTDATTKEWLVSAIPELSIQSDACLTLADLDTSIRGLLGLVEYWPEISRALTWTVVTAKQETFDATLKSYLTPDYAKDWRHIDWRRLTFRCQAKPQNAGANAVHIRTARLAKDLNGDEGLFRSARRATLAPLLKPGPAGQPPDPDRFPRLVEAAPSLGGVRFETLAITPSPYRPEAQAARYRELVEQLDTPSPSDDPAVRSRERLGRAMLGALDPSAREESAPDRWGLSDAALHNVAMNYYGGRAGTVANFVPDARTDAYHDYFGRQALPCDPWPQSTQDLMDFQEFWNGFLAYPALARIFGLTNDLVVSGATSLLSDGARFSIGIVARLDSTAALPAAVGADTRDLVNTVFSTPKTACNVIGTSVNGQHFVVVPRSISTPAISGVMALDGCRIESMNVDDAAHKLRSVAESEVCKEDSTVLGAGSDANMPAPSTWGLAVMHPSEERFAIAAPRTSADGEDELYAEHVTAGHRFDVRLAADVAGPWTSLCARRVKYASASNATLTIECPPPTTSADETALTVFEEGMVRNIGKKVKTGENDPRHLVGDELFVWQDWPLCVPAESDAPISTDSRLPYTQGLTLLDEHDLRLRFGWQYVVSARVAHLNGDGLTAEEAAEYRNRIAADPRNQYKLEVDGAFERQEPLRSPEVHVARNIDERVTPGDQIDVVIVRTGPDVPSEQHRSLRYVVPPRVSAEFASLHPDTFDGFPKLPKPPKGSLEHVFLTCSGDVPTVAEVQQAFPDKYVHGHTTAQHDNDTMIVFDDRFAEEINHEYYVDPAVRHVHLGLVASSSSCWADPVPSLQLVDDREWPTAKLFRLELEADRHLAEHCVAKWKGSFAGLFDPCRDTLSVRLAPAEELVLKIWCGTDDKRRAWLNAYQASAAILSREGIDPVSAFPRLLEVSLPFANPVRDVTLIHAVQKPLVVPRFDPDTVNIGRQHLGDTGVAFEGYALCDRASTGSLECFASWREFVDDVSLPEPHWIEPGKPSQAFPSVLLKRGAGFKDRVAFDVDDDGTKLAPRHQFGSTRHRTINYWLEGVSAHLKYFPTDWAHKCRTSYEDAAREGKVLTVSVPASESPDSPIVSAVVPLFTQQEDHRGGSDVVARTCTGFRVKIARPFFSHGDGQRLAVVCWPAGTFAGGPKYRPRSTAIGSQLRPATDIPSPLATYVSRIGQDPMWPGGSPFEVLPPEFFVGGQFGVEDIAFPGVKETAPEDPTDTPVIEQIAGTVSLVSFAVDPQSLDKTLQEYSCDIGININAVARRPEDRPYFPFIRLALAAYQQNAIEGATLSPVVVADLIQLHPDRRAQVIYQRRWSRARLIVSGFGRPEFLAASSVDESLTASAPAFEVRAQLLWRADDDAPPNPERATVLAIGRDADGYQATWDFDPMVTRKGGRFEILVEEVWLVPSDPKDTDPDGCTVRVAVDHSRTFMVKEYPRVLLKLPLLNC